jgi:hypothetical protein
MHEWEAPEKPNNWPSWGKVWSREHFEKEDAWNKEWDAGGKNAPRRHRDNDTRGSSPPPKAKEESSSWDNLSPRMDRDDDPFEDPPKGKYKSVGVITSGGGADYKPARARKKSKPASPKFGSDSESDSDSSESDDGKDNDPPPARKDPPPDDDKPQRRKETQAPWRPIRSPSKRSTLNKDNKEKKGHQADDTMSKDDVTMAPSPQYKQGEIVYYWSAEKTEYWVGVIRSIRYPTCEDEKIMNYQYEIEPEGVSLTTSVPSVLILQRDVRPLKWAIAHICPSCGPTEKGVRLEGEEQRERVTGVETTPPSTPARSQTFCPKQTAGQNKKEKMEKGRGKVDSIDDRRFSP